MSPSVLPTDAAACWRNQSLFGPAGNRFAMFWATFLMREFSLRPKDEPAKGKVLAGVQAGQSA
jgi:hypothetical protein